MPLLRITPWERAEDVVRLRHKFYEEGRPSQLHESLVQACDTVDAWAERGQVPHAVLATAALTRALIGDRRGDCQPAMLACSYSDALSNFVTGLVDAGQDAARKRSMFDVAKSIGLPDSYVGLRHDIVHEGFSNITELRRFGARALAWLHEEYWKHLGEDAGGGRAGLDRAVQEEEGACREGVSEETRTEIAAQLRSYGSSAKLSLKRKADEGERRGRSREYRALVVGKRLQPSVTNNAQLKALVQVLLDSNNMLSPPKKTALPLAVCDQWEPLLRVLHRLWYNFLPTLVQELLSILIRSSTSEESVGQPSYTCVLWLRRLSTSKSWQAARNSGQIAPRLILILCLANPGPYTTVLVLSLSGFEDLKTSSTNLDQQLLVSLSEIFAEVGQVEDEPPARGTINKGKKAGKARASLQAADKGKQALPKPGGRSMAFRPRPIGNAGEGRSRAAKKADRL